MKKSLLPVIGLVAGLLVACGGGNNAGSKADSKAPSSQKTSKASSSKHTHTYDETKWEKDATNHWHPATCEHTSQKGSSAAHTFVKDEAKSVAATCKAAGTLVEKCSVCGFEKSTPVAAGAHTWANVQEVKKEGESDYKMQTCSVCGKQDLCVDALKYVSLTGSLKSAPDASLKLNANGDHADYKFTADKGFNGVLAIYGWVDYFKDGSNNNESRGFFSRKSGEGTNLRVTINGLEVEITNHNTYEEMGMASRTDGTTNSTFALCEVGAASFAKGEVNVVYERVESYNLNITEIHFLGDFA